jgi:hypothetical protein
MALPEFLQPDTAREPNSRERMPTLCTTEIAQVDSRAALIMFMQRFLKLLRNEH